MVYGQGRFGGNNQGFRSGNLGVVRTFDKRQFAPTRAFSSVQPQPRFANNFSKFGGRGNFTQQRSFQPRTFQSGNFQNGFGRRAPRTQQSVALPVVGRPSFVRPSGGKGGFKGGKGMGKGKGKGKGGKPTAESLDRELEEYMGPDAQKARLDNELEKYMTG